MEIHDHNPKRTTGFIQQDHLDRDPYLEEMLVDEAQDKILYWTMFIVLVILILNTFAW